ncbi:PHP domain-containing protein [Geitlerinema sp. CS-897]|nr:PHP domain-containing protein [Geitlerinema sp. CS-897]
MLELHCHTTYSDGTLTPAQLVEAAVLAGVKALAITDHDTLSGWDEAREAARSHDLQIVPGVELSTVHCDRSLHVLGFYPDRELLKSPLRDRLQGRWWRARKIAENLEKMGYPVTLPQLGEGVAPSRPHIARAMVEAGYVRSLEEAFDRFLGDDKPAYVAYPKFTAAEGIELLRKCGGVPVWAHPYLFRGGGVETVLPELVEAGLMGIEVYHPHHRASQCRCLLELCDRYNLLATGGSDYHGPKVSGQNDYPLNSLNVSLSLLSPLQRAARNLKLN